MDYITTRSSCIEFNNNEKILKDYFGVASIEVQDIIDTCIQLLEENNDLKRNIEENYVEKQFDPYEEYGISENNFH